MAITINSNIASLNAQLNLSTSKNALDTSMQRLSSGLRINSAKDDAAGLAISDRMSSQIRGLAQATRNANDGISLAQTAEGAMQESTDILQRMRELSVQAGDGSNSDTDRASMQKEVSQLQQELNRISTSTSFNGKNLLDGSFTSQSFQVGASSGQTIAFSIGGTSATQLGTNAIQAGGTAGSINTASLAATNTVVGSATTINGYLGSKSFTDANHDSAKTIAADINAITSNTGVSATAVTNANITAAATGAISFTLQGSNTTAVTISGNISSVNDLTTISDAINAQSGNTGITASLSASKGAILLQDSQGDDIKIAGATGTTALGVTGVAADGSTLSGAAVAVTSAAPAATIGGNVTLNSTGSYSVTGADVTVIAAANVNSTLQSVSGIDISTQAGATKALSTIDSALSSIDNSRANLGAVQNRFQDTISNLQNISENVTAARSQIMDTDIASETANMTKDNILQQAGVSILVQANQQPQLALTLLKG